MRGEEEQALQAGAAHAAAAQGAEEGALEGAAVGAHAGATQGAPPSRQSAGNDAVGSSSEASDIRQQERLEALEQGGGHASRGGAQECDHSSRSARPNQQYHQDEG